MVRTIDLHDFRDAFVKMNRGDNFSCEGLEVLFDYFKELENRICSVIVLDVIAICCEFNEYTVEELIDNYGDSYLPCYEWFENSRWFDCHRAYCDRSDVRNVIKSKYVADLVAQLQNHTTILTVKNGNYIVQNFQEDSTMRTDIC